METYDIHFKNGKIIENQNCTQISKMIFEWDEIDSIVSYDGEVVYMDKKI